HTHRLNPSIIIYTLPFTPGVDTVTSFKLPQHCFFIIRGTGGRSVPKTEQKRNPETRFQSQHATISNSLDEISALASLRSSNATERSERRKEEKNASPRGYPCKRGKKVSLLAYLILQPCSSGEPRSREINRSAESIRSRSWRGERDRGRRCAVAPFVYLATVGGSRERPPECYGDSGLDRFGGYSARVLPTFA
ncbi:unnamed protein product, partial [Heterotrigona itama]